MGKTHEGPFHHRGLRVSTGKEATSQTFRETLTRTTVGHCHTPVRAVTTQNRTPSNARDGAEKLTACMDGAATLEGSKDDTFL